MSSARRYGEGDDAVDVPPIQDPVFEISDVTAALVRECVKNDGYIDELSEVWDDPGMPEWIKDWTNGANGNGTGFFDLLKPNGILYDPEDDD